jgi:penicillin-binding protein 1C
MADTPLSRPPEGLKEVEICALSGMRANPSCPSRVREWLPAGSDALPCSWHHASDEGLIVVWPPEYREWALQQGLLQDLRGRRVIASREEGAATPDAHRVANERRLEIVNPPAGALYSIDPTLRPEFQAIALAVVAPVPGAIEWRVDGAPVGRASSDERLLWSLTPGSHVITARDESGRTARTTIVVR